MEASRISNTLLQHFAEIFNWFVFWFLFVTWRSRVNCSNLLGYSSTPLWHNIKVSYDHLSHFVVNLGFGKRKRKFVYIWVYPAQMCEESKGQSLSFLIDVFLFGILVKSFVFKMCECNV